MRLTGCGVPSFKGVGAENIVIVLIYFIALRKYKGAETVMHDVAEKNIESKWAIWGKFIGFLLIVVVLGAWMANNWRDDRSNDWIVTDFYRSCFSRGCDPLFLK